MELITLKRSLNRLMFDFNEECCVKNNKNSITRVTQKPEY